MAGLAASDFVPPALLAKCRQNVYYSMLIDVFETFFYMLNVICNNFVCQIRRFNESLITFPKVVF